MNQQKENVPKRYSIGSILSTVVLVISMILCLTVVVQIMTNGYVQIGGFSLFRVVTGSMEPELPVGTLLLCKKTPIDAIEEGDIVCFVSRSPEMMGRVITHRVVTIYDDQAGKILLETKGDANLSADGEFVTASNLIGRVNRYEKDGSFMPSLINLLTDRVGFFLIILFPTLLIAGFILRSCMSNMRRDLQIVLDEEKRSKKDTSNLYTEEEYAAMLERIKRELVEEMMQNAGEIIQESEEGPTTE